MACDIHTDVRYAPLEVIEVGRLADECPECWWNQTLSRVNDSVVLLGVFGGEIHFHHHDREDELFFVLEGRLLLDKGRFLNTVFRDNSIAEAVEEKEGARKPTKRTKKSTMP